MKTCLVCNTQLVLKSSRDITRKRFCSRSCSNSYNTTLRLSKIGTRVCKVCNKNYIARSTTQKYCSDDCSATNQVKRSYKYLNNNPEGYIKHLLARPNRKALPYEYIIELYNNQKGRCALSNIEMTFTKVLDNVKVHTNLSIDRIDSSKGYEIGNIQLVCAIVNIMKSTLTIPELTWWCERIVDGGYSNSKF